MRTPGVTTHNPTGAHVGAFKYPPFFDSLDGIVRTRRLVAAFIGTQHGRNQNLICPDREDKQKDEKLSDVFHRYKTIKANSGLRHML